MRYVIKKWGKDEFTEPQWEIGEKIGKTKRKLYTFRNFLISQLDDQYVSDELFDAVAKMWKDGIPEEEVKAYYKKAYYDENKKLYDYEFHALTEMRKKNIIQSKPKRKVTKRCRKKFVRKVVRKTRR